MNMSKKNGQSFYRILSTMLSVVLIMSIINVLLVSYMRASSIEMQIDTLSNSMKNGAVLMDDFFTDAFGLYGTLYNDAQLTNLATKSRMNLEQTRTAQTTIADKLSQYQLNAKYASEAYLFIYGKPYVISSAGVTDVSTFFNNRFNGDYNKFCDMLYCRYSFDVVRWPFNAGDTTSDYYVDSKLAMVQSVYVDGKAYGTLVITLDSDAMPGVLGRYRVVSDCTAYLLLDGDIVAPQDADVDLSMLPEGDFSGHVKGVGLAVRRRSEIIPNIEYLVIKPESAIMPGFTQVIVTTNWVIAIAAALMIAAAYLASKQLYSPLKKLVGEVNGKVDAHTDEAELLLKAIRDIHSENSDIKVTLDSSTPLVRDALLYHLLRGSSNEERLLMDKYLPAADTERCFYAFVITIVFETQDAEKDGGEPGEKLLARMQQDFGLHIISTVKTGGAEYALVTYPLTAEEYAAICDKLAVKCNALGAEYPRVMILAASGEGVAHIDRIAVSFRQAREFIYNRPVTRVHSFIPISESSTQTNGYMPMDMDTRLASLINSGTESGAWEYIAALLRRNRECDVPAQEYVKIAYLINIVITRMAHTQYAMSATTTDRLIAIHPAHTLIRPEQLDDILRDNLAIVMSKCAPEYSDMDRITDYMAKNYNAGINLNSTAEHFGYNANYFSRYFKQRMGVNFTDYLNRLKVDNACRLLKEPGVSVKDAGEKSGFNSSGQFITVFERLVGTTPGAYKKQEKA